MYNITMVVVVYVSFFFSSIITHLLK